MRIGMLGRLFCVSILAGGLGACANPHGMGVYEPSADVAHSGKALVIASSVEDLHGLFGASAPSTRNIYVNADLTTPGPDGKVRDQFQADGYPEAYLIEPGHYYLADVYNDVTHSDYNFDQAHSQVHFAVHAGEVVYLGALHLAQTSNPDHPTCGAGVSFTVENALAADLPKVEKDLAGKYPGAKALLRTSLMQAAPGVQILKPAGGCLF